MFVCRVYTTCGRTISIRVSAVAIDVIDGDSGLGGLVWESAGCGRV